MYICRTAKGNTNYKYVYFPFDSTSFSLEFSSPSFNIFHRICPETYFIQLETEQNIDSMMINTPTLRNQRTKIGQPPWRDHFSETAQKGCAVEIHTSLYEVWNELSTTDVGLLIALLTDWQSQWTESQTWNWLTIKMSTHCQCVFTQSLWLMWISGLRIFQFNNIIETVIFIILEKITEDN